MVAAVTVEMTFWDPGGGDEIDAMLCLARNDGIRDADPGGEVILITRVGGVPIGDWFGVELGVSKPETGRLTDVSESRDFD